MTTFAELTSRMPKTVQRYGERQPGRCSRCSGAGLVLGTLTCETCWVEIMTEGLPDARRSATVSGSARDQAVRALALRVIAARSLPLLDVADDDATIDAAVAAGFVAEADHALVPGKKEPAKIPVEVRARALVAEIERAGRPLTYNETAERLGQTRAGFAPVISYATANGLVITTRSGNVRHIAPAKENTP